MTPDGLLAQIAAVRTFARRDERAPHKPLLLLLALGRVTQGRDRLIPYEVLEPQLRRLLRDFGPPRKAVHPVFPFRWLLTDGLWEIPEFVKLSKNASGDLYISELKERGIEGGLPKDVYELLRADPGLVRRAADQILREHFPESLHREILDAVRILEDGIRREAEDASVAPEVRERDHEPTYYLTRVRWRDPVFRRKVLEAYEERCSVCDFDIRLGDQLLGMEAAHIQWHSHGGPDHVANGLALCLFHHKALDRGALGLEERRGTGFNVLISGDVRGETTASLADFDGRRIRPPRAPAMPPAPSFVAWHRKEVFRGPGP